MADFQLDFDDSIFKDLEKLSDTEAVSEKMLKEASSIVASSMKSELNIHRQTAELVNSVKPTKPKKNKSGDNVVVVRPHASYTSIATARRFSFLQARPSRR